MDEIRIGPSELQTPLEQRPPWLDSESAEGSGRPEEVAILMGEAAFLVIEEQASGSLDEVGGLLLGEAFLWKGRLFVEIEAAIEGERTKSGPAHITFTAETWAALLRRKERELPAKRIVGWYHSHPRMGIFLSEMDLTLHRHFFPQPWHVALVINGQDRNAGFFAWSDEEIQPVPHIGWAGTRGRLALHMGEHPFKYEYVVPEESESLPGEAASRPTPSRTWLLIAGVLILMFSLRRRKKDRTRPRRDSLDEKKQRARQSRFRR